MAKKPTKEEKRLKILAQTLAGGAGGYAGLVGGTAGGFVADNVLPYFGKKERVILDSGKLSKLRRPWGFARGKIILPSMLAGTALGAYLGAKGGGKLADLAQDKWGLRSHGKKKTANIAKVHFLMKEKGMSAVEAIKAAYPSWPEEKVKALAAKLEAMKGAGESMAAKEASAANPYTVKPRKPKALIHSLKPMTAATSGRVSWRPSALRAATGAGLKKGRIGYKPGQSPSGQLRAATEAAKIAPVRQTTTSQTTPQLDLTKQNSANFTLGALQHGSEALYESFIKKQAMMNPVAAVKGADMARGVWRQILRSRRTKAFTAQTKKNFNKLLKQLRGKKKK